jgi:arylsulfatase A-like enzyme
VPDAVPKRPNVVLITVDALRWDHVGAYGYARPTTPRIDALAREGVLFRSGWAHSPSTRYSVPAILTGRYESTIAWGSPQEHWPPSVLPENRMMAEAFKDRGYRTAAILPAPYFLPRAANAHMSMWGLDQGFDHYDTSLAPLHSHAGGDPAKATGSSSRQLADLTVKWIGEHAAPQQDSPFFLWVHFYDPHYLYERHPDCAECSFGPRDVDLYDGEVRFTDLHIGRVLDALREHGAWDDTIVVVTADHGEGFGEHGVSQHGYHIYSAQNRVPFIVKVPGVAPRAVDEPVGHVDLFPSLLNLIRAPDEPQLLGDSFLDLMLGGGNPRLVFGEVDYEGPTQRKSVASRTHHLISNVIPDGTCEFYDLGRDPLEEHDLFVRGAGGEQGRLFSALGEWMDESALPADFAERVQGNIATQQIRFDRALGAEVGGVLVVDGVSVPNDHPRAGDQVEVDLVMHATKAPTAGWRLFTHALGGPGGTFLNLDHEPVEGLLPLARLKPGRWVRDRIRFNVPPSWRGATIRLDVGLFHGSVRAPIRLPGGGSPSPHDDRLTVATLNVQP